MATSAAVASVLERAIAIEERRGAPVWGNIPLSRLHMIAEYQRDLDVDRAQKMARGWRQDAMGVLYVSERGRNEYVIMDGQTRAAALGIVSGASVDPLVPCLVYRNLTEREEAELFVFFNGGRKQPKVGEVFRADVKAGNPDALGLIDVASEFGLRIAYGGQHDGSITAIQSLRTIWRLGGRGRLWEVLHVLHAAYGKERSGYQSGMLRGVDLVLERYSKDSRFTLDRLIDTLRHTDPTVILRRVQAIAPPRTNIATPHAFSRAISEFYNKGLRAEKRLPDWNGGDNVMVGRGKRNQEGRVQ